MRVILSFVTLMEYCVLHLYVYGCKQKITDEILKKINKIMSLI